MVKAVDIKATIDPLPVLDGRTPETTSEQAEGSFATLVEYEDGGVFAGSFIGESPWERHPNGDELVQILDGAAEVTVITDEGRQVLDMKAGMLTVVPRNCWHKFNAPGGVTVMTMTPQPTVHTSAMDPVESE